jgi:carboxymethylenebutenolidase
MADRPRRLTAQDFDPQVLRLFDQYVHGQIDRRGFLDRAARYAVGGTTAAGLLAALSPNFAQAQQVKPDDARLKTSFVEFDSPKGYGKVRAYVARPVTGGPWPAVLVAHENRGLNPHIEDIARRLALDQFIVLAPDALFPLGGYPGDEDKARTLFSQLDQQKTRQDFIASAAYALAGVTAGAVGAGGPGLVGANGQLGAIGFCYGGGVVNMLATQVPALKVGVPFYGEAPPTDDVTRIKASMLLIFAGNDDRINGGWPAYEAALKKDGVRYEAIKYAGTQHGFNNDTTPRFDADAASKAWAHAVGALRGALQT